MGLPVLHGVTGESAKIVRDEGVGIVFEPENAKDLVDQLLYLYGNQDICKSMKERCLAAAHKYDRSFLAAEMLRIITSATLPSFMSSGT
jgi:hypothetical protein